MTATEVAAVLEDARDRLRAATILAEATRDRYRTGPLHPTAVEVRDRIARVAAEAHRLLLLIAELKP